MIEIEKRLQDILVNNDYKVFKNGWPDFLVEDPDGELFMIEVKSSADRIRKPQQKMLQKLANLGFRVFVVSENRKENLEAKFDWRKFVGDNQAETLDQITARVQLELVKEALSLNHGDIQKTANYLDISTRSLRYKLDKYRIRAKHFKG